MSHHARRDERIEVRWHGMSWSTCTVTTTQRGVLEFGIEIFQGGRKDARVAHVVHGKAIGQQ